MTSYYLVRIKTSNKSRILLKLNKINVNIRNIKYEKDYLIFEIEQSDIKRVKKYLISEKLEIIGGTGFNKIKTEIRKNLLFIVGIIFSVIIFLILTNIIVKVNIIHSDKEIREILEYSLKERGVEALTFKKSYKEYEAIIASIKEEYKDRIEWLEIDVDGMVINVRVEERIQNKTNKKYETCHIVASKSGIVTGIRAEKGVTEVKMGDHVKKGDILINGMIKLNEEVKNNVCASGEVYAEVWYTISASLPLDYEEERLTGKWRYNLMLKDSTNEYNILKSRIAGEKEIEKHKLFKVFNWEFYLTKEHEKLVNKKKYNEKEATKELTNIIHEKLETRGIKNSDILNEKVLKKNVFNGNLDIVMFVAVKEQIGVAQFYNVED